MGIRRRRRVGLVLGRGRRGRGTGEKELGNGVRMALWVFGLQKRWDGVWIGSWAWVVGELGRENAEMQVSNAVQVLFVFQDGATESCAAYPNTQLDPMLCVRPVSQSSTVHRMSGSLSSCISQCMTSTCSALE
jgi:hypothetical protein